MVGIELFRLVSGRPCGGPVLGRETTYSTVNSPPYVTRSADRLERCTVTTRRGVGMGAWEKHVGKMGKGFEKR
jgi:hypothetical protein